MLALVGVPLFSSVSPTAWSRTDAIEQAHIRFFATGTTHAWQTASNNEPALWISNTWAGTPAIALHRAWQRLKVTLEDGGQPEALDTVCTGNPSHAARVCGSARLPVATAPWQLRFRATGWTRAPGRA